MVTVVLHDSTRLEFRVAEANRRGVRRTSECETGRIPRISRLMALALKLDRLRGAGPAIQETAVHADQLKKAAN